VRSLLYRLSPEHCRMITIDSKMLELSVYEGIPHLLSPVVTDPKKAVVALKWTVAQDGRARLFGFDPRWSLRSGQALRGPVARVRCARACASVGRSAACMIAPAAREFGSRRPPNALRP
jgi:hypothetical protein